MCVSIVSGGYNFFYAHAVIAFSPVDWLDEKDSFFICKVVYQVFQGVE